ncbi:MAG: prepilin-type N-terminal cleavage/methylation domain-containing protein, partial [Rickettsiales bacterium]
MQKKYKKFQIKKAFSLVELSIVILITSILITGALVV